MLHFLALKSAQNLLLVSQLLHIVTGTHCDCGPIFCYCYDVLSLYFVTIMMFMHTGNDSDCGFSFIKLKDLAIMGQKSFSIASQ